MKKFEIKDKSDYSRLTAGVHFLSEFYTQGMFSLDYWKGVKGSIQEVQDNLEEIVSGQGDYLTEDFTPVEKLSDEDTVFNDVLVTVKSFKKKISFIEEQESFIRYFEKINDSVYKRWSPKKDIYMLQKNGEPAVVYTHRKILRYGDYFILDKNGMYFGANIGIGSARWQQNENVILSTGNTASLGIEFGYRFYFKSSIFKYTHGIHLGGRVDAIIGGKDGILAPTILLGYSGVLKLNKTQAIEFGLNVGPAFFIDDVHLDSFIPVPIFELGVNDGVTGVVSSKYRFKHLYLGLEYLYVYGRSVEFDYGSAERHSICISIGKVF